MPSSPSRAAFSSKTASSSRTLRRAPRLPAVLRRFYTSYGTAADAFLVNHLLPPADVAEDGGVTVFYVEEQAVYLWGIATEDLASEDPPVHWRENEPGKP